jgi:hypothetical protein
VGDLTSETPTAPDNLPCPDDGAAEAMTKVAVVEVINVGRTAIMVVRKCCPVDVVVDLELWSEQVG